MRTAEVSQMALPSMIFLASIAQWRPILEGDERHVEVTIERTTSRYFAAVLSDAVYNLQAARRSVHAYE